MSTAVDFVNGPVSQNFLANPYSPVQPWGHTGKDYAVPVGTNCYAIAPGRVIWCGNGALLPRVFCQEMMFIFGSPDSGNIMLIQHDGWVAGYFHLSGYPPGVDDGVEIRRGQVVAYSGNTGRSTGPHVHVETLLRPSSSQPVYSRYNPTNQVNHENAIAAKSVPAPIKLNQRVNGNHVSVMRTAPKLTAPVIPGADIPPNRLEEFVGYAIGDTVKIGNIESNIWYMDEGPKGGEAPRYVSAILFTEQKITGLPNRTVTVETLKPNQRKTGPAGANMRTFADPNAAFVRAIAPNTVEGFTHWEKGPKLTITGVTTDIWYRDSTGVAWAGVFTTQSTDGLIEYKPVVTPNPTPETPKPTPAKTFEKDLSCVTEVIQAGDGNFAEGNFPIKPRGIVIHQFIAGTQRFDVHIQSVINEFLKIGVQKSSHLAIEAKKITQMVKFTNRAYHGGPAGNDLLGFETYGGQDEETLNSVAIAIYETEIKFGYKMELFTHNKLDPKAPTQCGDQVDLNDLRRRADAIHAKNNSPIDPKPPVVEDNSEATKFYNGLYGWLKNWFTSGK